MRSDTINRKTPDLRSVPREWAAILDAYDFEKAAEHCRRVDFRWYGHSAAATADEMRSWTLTMILDFNRQSKWSSSGGVIIVWTDDEKAIVTCMNEPERFKEIRGWLPKQFDPSKPRRKSRVLAPKA